MSKQKNKRDKQMDYVFEVLNTRSDVKSKKTKEPPVELDKALKKKKKKKSNEEPVLPKEKKDKLKAKLSKSKKKLEKALERDFDVTKEQLPSVIDRVSSIVPSSSESEFLDTYMTMFDNLRTLVQVAELKYAESEQSRDVYALMAMYSQLRETIADMRSVQDMSQQAHSLVVAVIEPTMQAIAQIMVDMYYQTSLLLRHHVTESKQEEALKTLKMVTATHAKRVEDQFSVAKDKIYSTLSSK